MLNEVKRLACAFQCLFEPVMLIAVSWYRYTIIQS